MGIHSAKQAVRDALRAAAWPVLRIALPRGPKKISAMVRVRNEEQFLRASIMSIVETVDEVVLIDNLSDDATPEIIAELVRRHPDKVRSFRYPHEVARFGPDNIALAASPGGAGSPRLLANYYNWCLARCTTGWIVKWDADMVALPEFAIAVDRYRASGRQVMHFSGANIHPDRAHYMANDDFCTSIDDYEPRLFTRRFARYADYGGPCEAFYSPYRVGRWAMRHEPLTFVHLKYCKLDPHAGRSDERPDTFAPGEVLPAAMAELVATLDR